MTQLKILILVISLHYSASPLAQASEVSAQISKALAVQKAKDAEKGRVLKVITKEHAYQIKMLQASGRVVLVEVDKKSGIVKSRKVKN